MLNCNRVNPLTSLTDFVFHIFILCGTNPNIVKRAAVIPIKVHNISSKNLTEFFSQKLKSLVGRRFKRSVVYFLKFLNAFLASSINCFTVLREYLWSTHLVRNWGGIVMIWAPATAAFWISITLLMLPTIILVL